jgi:LPXTG-site transpeptidase (sortase) family protein
MGLFSYILVVVGLFGTTYFIYQLANTSNNAPPINLQIPAPSAATQVTPINKATATSVPTRLNIPKINVDVPITPVGQNADGTMQTPGYYDNLVGWYKHSPIPGNQGPSVVVGHVGNKKGPSVFWDLGLLSDGDKIDVYGENGNKTTFVVTSKQQFDQNNFPTEAVYGDIDHAGLRLITCGGVFDKSAQRYTKNTVIFARLTQE